MYLSALPKGSYLGSWAPRARFPAQVPHPLPHVHASFDAALQKLNPDLIEPKKPKLNITVQEHQAAKASKKKHFDISQPNLFRNKRDEGRGTCQLLFGGKQGDFRAWKSGLALAIRLQFRAGFGELRVLVLHKLSCRFSRRRSISEFGGASA